MAQYKYFTHDLRQTQDLFTQVLDNFTERHFVKIDLNQDTKETKTPYKEVKNTDYDIIIALDSGLIDKKHLKISKIAIARGSKAWFYWPRESAIELIDKEKLQSYTRHYRFIKFLSPIAKLIFGVFLDRNKEKLIFREKLLNINHYPTPVDLSRLAKRFENNEAKGVFLGIEPLKELSKEFLSLDITSNTPDTFRKIKTLLQNFPPDFIYEKISTNYAGALISKELKIPYIVEHSLNLNGENFEQYEKAAIGQASVIIASEHNKEKLLKKGIVESKIITDKSTEKLKKFILKFKKEEKQKEKIETGDNYKDQVQEQWNNNPCGSQYAQDQEKHTLSWFQKVEDFRYNTYGNWMPKTMEFDQHPGKKVLEIGAGLGTDLAQFAKHGSITTDLDLSKGHLELAQKNFKLRELEGKFIHGDGEKLPFDDNAFDVIYSNGVIHHTPNTKAVVAEIYRVLKPGGKIIIMVYAENSLHYWYQIMFTLGIRFKHLQELSPGGIMSHHVEVTEENEAKPLVKVYTKERLKKLFEKFTKIDICKRQLNKSDLSSIFLIPLRFFPISFLEKTMGWNLIIKAQKPTN